jgi:hypothetical protein
MSTEIRRNPWKRWSLEALALFVGVGALIYAGLILRGTVTEADTYYHFKVASLILHNGPWVDISWLPFTVLGEHGTDHHWLWHVVLAPFALIEDPWQAITIAAAATCAAVTAVVLLVCRGLAIPYAPLVAILVTFAGPSLPERLTRLRSENVAYVLLSLALLFMAKRRYLALAVVSFVFMASYHGAVLLIPMVLTFTLATFKNTRRPSLGNIIAVLGGITAGLVFSPWFPDNIYYLFFHTLFKLSSENWYLSGTEWLAPSWMQILQTSWLIHLLLAAAIGLFASRRVLSDRTLRLSEETLATLFMVAISLVMYHGAWRNAAYYTLFGLLAAALLWRDSAIQFTQKRLSVGFAALCTAVSASVLWVGTQSLIAMPMHSPMNRYQTITQYLEDHTKQGDIVFNVAWTDFTSLFWQSDKLRYVNGLDGNYLAFGDPERFKVWYDINRQVPIEGGASRALRKTFNTEWVVIPRSEEMDKIAMGIIDGGDAETEILNQDGWLIHLKESAAPATSCDDPQKCDQLRHIPTTID